MFFDYLHTRHWQHPREAPPNGTFYQIFLMISIQTCFKILNTSPRYSKSANLQLVGEAFCEGESRVLQSIEIS